MHFSTRVKEHITIILAWGLIYVSTPLYMYYALLVIDEDFELRELLNGWCYITAFLVLFLINHYILLPRLVERKRIVAYVACIMVALGLFVAFLLQRQPQFRPGDRPETMEIKVSGHRHHAHKAFPIAPPDMARLVIALLMLGVDLGVVAWFNGQKMRERLLMLEQQNLKQELEHLRYQINPHFFMNTLNNIHALIDIDGEWAKRAIVELSGLMRYAIYEGNGSKVDLAHEVEFLKHYISLMKMRFTDKVVVNCMLPDNTHTNAVIPPLLFVTFVENAFKHGVSYRESSFININLNIDNDNQQICFECENSNHSASVATEDGCHGIGLQNVRKRLNLLYADNYSLNIENENSEIFKVKLILPAMGA